MDESYGDRLGQYAQLVVGYKLGEMVSLMIYLGDQLGLYQAMSGRDSVNAGQLAEETGLDERWLQEWLRGQGAAGVINHVGEERFQLPDVAEEALLNDDSPAFLTGFFFRPPSHEIIDRTMDAFKTGLGVSWGDHGDGASHFLCRSNRPFHLRLPEHVIPLLEGMGDRLAQGADVLDIGCGSGHALSVLASAYPNSRFLGIDPAANMIAQANTSYGDIGNVRYEVGYGESINETNQYDLITTFDCMHDMTDPIGTMKAVRGAIRDSGSWLIKDIRSHDTYAENLENPVAAMMYGFSVLYCMSSALSKSDGAGLGTLGFPPAVCQQMGAEAGFSSFKFLEYEDDPFNNYFELRP